MEAVNVADVEFESKQRQWESLSDLWNKCRNDQNVISRTGFQNNFKNCK